MTLEEILKIVAEATKAYKDKIYIDVDELLELIISEARLGINDITCLAEELEVERQEARDETIQDLGD